MNLIKNGKSVTFPSQFKICGYLAMVTFIIDICLMYTLHEKVAHSDAVGWGLQKKPILGRIFDRK